MKRFVLLASLVGAAACGDNLSPEGTNNDGSVAVDSATIDSATIDGAPPPDAATDAAIDATPPPAFTGTLTVIEAQVIAPAPNPSTAIAAQGIQLGITFTETATAVQPVLDTMPGSLFGCKVTELTPAQALAATGVNEGTVQFTVDNPPTPNPPPDPPPPPEPADPTYPPCVFIPGGTGYICPDAASSQAITVANSVTLMQISATTSRLTVNAGPATFSAEDVGRYVKFSGTGTGFDQSHVAIPIVALGPTSNVVIIGTGIPVPTIPLTMGMLSTLAGVGPMPGLQDPGQLSNGASATAVITPGGGNHFPMTTITYGNVGDDFTMTAANSDLMRNIPRDGSAFTLNCDMCGTSIGTVLNITTTDAPVVGQSPFAMPASLTKRVNIRCAAVGTGLIEVTPEVSAYIMNSGATRIQAIYIRGTFGSANPQNAGLAAVIAGHALVGFTTPTAP